jgi:hypothetical protein
MDALDSARRPDRRSVIKWMLAAAASIPLLERSDLVAADSPGPARGYGPDPDRQRIYRPGDLWPLTLTPLQRRTAAALCDTIMPADATSPSASTVGVPEFIDEWISSPYPVQGEDLNLFRRPPRRDTATATDRTLVLDLLDWMETEAQQRFHGPFASLSPDRQRDLCDAVCDPARAAPDHRPLVPCFKRFRDLTIGGYFTTPEGMEAIGYRGNVPLPSFEGPPPEVLRQLGLL